MLWRRNGRELCRFVQAAEWLGRPPGPAPVCVVGVNAPLPVSIQRPAAADGADRLADDVIVERGAGAVTAIVGGAARVDAERVRRLYGVDIRAEEQKLPAVFCLFLFDHLPDVRNAVAAAGVFHSVGRDDEQRVFRHVLRPRVFVDVGDVVDRAADGVEQRRAAAHGVVVGRQRANVLHVHAVVNDLARAVKQHGRDKRRAVRLFLLFDHGVEAADRIRLQPRHGTAAVEEKDDLCQALFHVPFLLKSNMTARFSPCSHILASVRAGVVAWQATLFTCRGGAGQMRTAPR